MASSSSEFVQNNYATKKTLTEGFLDLALLMTSAAQLKHLVDVGPHYKFYPLLLSFVCVSIILQVIRGCLNVALGAFYDIDDEAHQKTATVLNNIVLGLGLLTTVVNTIISAFDMNEFKVN